jgi:phosphoribosylanthranilate isomerase
MKVKICGITSVEDAVAAVEAGADALGFNLYPKSPRFLDPDRAAAISRALPPFVTRVAVTVDMPIAEIREIERVVRFDLWQLHGGESPETVSELLPRRMVKVFGLPADGGLADLFPAHDPQAYPVDGYLLDKLSPKFGGTGETFDWRLAVEFQKCVGRPCILSGGLGVNNVVQAIETVKSYGVDVCSGVEREPGVKDHSVMKEFIELCRKS